MTDDGATMAPHRTTRQERRGRISKHPRRLVRWIGRHSDRAQPEVSVVLHGQSYKRCAYVSVRKWSERDRTMLSSRKAPPSPGSVPVAKPRTTIQLPPRAESPVRPSNAPCPNISREPQPDKNACHGR